LASREGRQVEFRDKKQTGNRFNQWMNAKVGCPLRFALRSFNPRPAPSCWATGAPRTSHQYRQVHSVKPLFKSLYGNKYTLTVSDEEKADAFYRIVLSASRMLLVTRGIEAPSDEAVFTSFLQHFIAAGLVAEEHRPVVELAKAGKTAKLTARPEAVLTLAESVHLLYESMDNSLRFPAEKPATPATSQAAVVLPLRDYRGVACPMNFVKVKLDLAKMKAGEQIKVLLDDGQPIENVPRSVAGEGHLVRDQKSEGEHWSVVIEKR